jgi:S1-C subfamily serine protease/predicted esterase
MIPQLRLLTLACTLVAAPVTARAVDAIAQETLREAVAKVAPSVVQIETVGGADQIGDLAVGTGPTTGLVVDADGHIVSSSINFAHKPSCILVRLPDGQRLAARLVATDHHRKIALLEVDGANSLPVPEFVEPKQVRVGQWAIAVGRAFDPEHANLAVGIISALNRVWGKALQTDAAVSPNNYGGPLIDLRGNVVGLLVPMSPTSDEEVAGVEWYDSGIGFAVPADLVLQTVSRLKAGEDLHAGLFGTTLQKSVAMSGPAVVSSVLPNSPAEKAGLEKGDRIVRFDAANIRQSAQIRYELAARYAGDTVSLLVRRGDETIECEATLVAKLEPYRCPLLGILPERGKDQEPGPAVRLTIPASPAAQADILPADRILSLDGEPITDVDDLRSRIARRKTADNIALELITGKERRSVDVILAEAPTSLPEDLPAPAIDPDAPAGREVTLTLPERNNKVKAYLPKAYTADVPHGLLVWLRSVSDEPAKIALWKQHADSRSLVVVLVEPSSTEQWLPGEAELIRDVLQLCKKRFSLDPRRLVVGGQAGGGVLAYRVATRERDTLTGCIVFDARPPGPQLTDHPDNRFSLLIGQSDKGRLTEVVDRIVNLLRKGGLPVIALPRNGPPDQLTDQDAAVITRWIDMLDQI